MPKVSVVIPAYNCERFISTAIESVLNQSYKDYEIIIVDDGSTDKTAEVIKQYSENIIYIYQSNGGPSKARNTGVFNARGQYIAFLDQDDAWLPDKLKMQVSLLEENKDVRLAYTDTYILDDKSFANHNAQNKRSFQIRCPHRGEVLQDLFLDNFISTSSVMVYKECFKKVGMFDLFLPPIADYDRWLRIAALYKVDYIDKPLVKFRDHSACFRRDTILVATNVIKTLNGIIADYPVIKNMIGDKVNKRLSQFYVILGKLYLTKGSFKKALYNFSVSFKLTKSLFLPFSILFSFLGDYIKSIFRYIKLKIRKQK
ncbi:MAG: glycosyltransferase [Candidatus Omnitrophica bacterium]|nr:glycosyltransferase [Candidatus Omnitrophota bacterium]